METTTAEIETAPEEIAAALKASRRDTYLRLAETLGDGAQWEYRGECADLGSPRGTCTCGHAGIRYEFTLHHADGRSAVVGSSCIETYQGVSTATAAAILADLEKLKAAGRERIRQAKEAAKAAAVQALLAEWSGLEYDADAVVLAYARRWDSYRLPFRVYNRNYAGLAGRLEGRNAGKLHPFCRVPAMKTTTGQAARLKKEIAKAVRHLAELREIEPPRCGY